MRAILSCALMLAALSSCVQLAVTRTPHPFEEQLDGEWYYDCRYFAVGDDLPVSLEGHAIYFEGRTRERIAISVGTDCSEAGRFLVMRFDGTYRIGNAVSVKLADGQVRAYQDTEVKTKVTYELTPTFASLVGRDPACAALVGRRMLDGSEPALAKCELTKDFRELEVRSQNDRTVLFIDQCRLFNGDDKGDLSPEGFPTTLDTRSWGVKACRQEQQ